MKSAGLADFYVLLNFEGENRSRDVSGDNVYVGGKNVGLSFKKLEDQAKASEKRTQKIEERSQQSEQFLIGFAEILIDDKELTMSRDTRNQLADLIKNFRARLGGTEIK
ncbi:MAG: hypothetical protein F4Z14_07260 [Gammaproteobacteria bacterium]|nr:hypothetical protein [Gammaproteobacteria bacterium]